MTRVYSAVHVHLRGESGDLFESAEQDARFFARDGR